MQPAVSHGLIVDHVRDLVWFTDLESDYVGVIHPPSGFVGELPAITLDSEPYFITVAPNGGVWYTSGMAPVLGFLPCTD